MHLAKTEIVLSTVYCQSRAHTEKKLPKELADDYERRTWKSRLHTDEDGVIYIPGMAFANCVKEAAKFLSIQVPGKGKATWTKHFDAGVSVLDNVPTGIHKDDKRVTERRLFVPSDGVRGSGKRVWKSFPVIPLGTMVTVDFQIVDETITTDVFAMHLQQAGFLIGIGAFRKRNNGPCGQFAVKSIEWHENFAEEHRPEITVIKHKKREKEKAA